MKERKKTAKQIEEEARLKKWVSSVGSQIVRLEGGNNQPLSEGQTSSQPITQSPMAEGAAGMQQSGRMLFAKGSGDEQSEMAAVTHNLAQLDQLPLEGVDD